MICNRCQYKFLPTLAIVSTVIAIGKTQITHLGNLCTCGEKIKLPPHICGD
jgi:hypothetical protein